MGGFICIRLLEICWEGHKISFFTQSHSKHIRNIYEKSIRYISEIYVGKVTKYHSSHNVIANIIEISLKHIRNIYEKFIRYILEIYVGKFTKYHSSPPWLPNFAHLTQSKKQEVILGAFYLSFKNAKGLLHTFIASYQYNRVG